MAYRVILMLESGGQIGVIVATASEAIRLVDDFFEDGAIAVEVKDLDGNVIELNEMRISQNHDHRL